MTTQFRISKNTAREETVVMRSGDSLGMDLGELRAALKAAEGLADESQVRFGSFKDSIIEGEYFAGIITIRERSAL